MLSNIAQESAKTLGGARFFLVNVLPGTLLTALILAVSRSGAYGSGEATLAAIVPSRDELSAGGAIILIFALVVTGVLLQPFQIALVQLLEGYWGHSRPGHAVARLAIERHRRRYTTAQILQDAKISQALGTRRPTFTQLAQLGRAQSMADRTKNRAKQRLKQYPVDPDHLMPTMLGNILRNGEDYAGDRYRLNALIVYPRMYPSLSKPLAEAMSRQLDLIGTTAALCVSFGVATLATSPLLRRLDLWSSVPVVVLLLAMLSYRSALRAADTHATLFATTFDLHRFDMLSAMHYPLHEDVERERELNHQLTVFLQGREEPHPELAEFGYVHPPLAPTTAPVTLTAVDDAARADTGLAAEKEKELSPAASPEPTQAETPQPPNPPDPTH